MDPKAWECGSVAKHWPSTCNADSIQSTTHITCDTQMVGHTWACTHISHAVFDLKEEETIDEEWGEVWTLTVTPGWQPSRNISILQEKKPDSADSIIKSRFFLPSPPIPSEISVQPTFLLGSVWLYMENPAKTLPSDVQSFEINGCWCKLLHSGGLSHNNRWICQLLCLGKRGCWPSRGISQLYPTLILWLHFVMLFTCMHASFLDQAIRRSLVWSWPPASTLHFW